MIFTSDVEISRAGVVFKYGNPQPVWIESNGEKVSVKEIFYSWTERKGHYLIYKYTFTDGFDAYEIALNSLSMKWFLIAREEL
ncbi:MAG: hypothetical protein FXF54_00645 [Kosmotoga sp.]|nr:MAG: hypothetical protein FXF54_00645 [Kosmotoga sp.]